MEFAHVLAFNLALLAAWLSPGPAMLVALRAAITNGAGSGAATGVGLAIAASFWTAAALFGLDAVFRLFPWTYGALKLVGALYLIWIAIQTWRHARAPLSATPEPSRRAVRRGLLVNLGNPKSVLFAGAVLVVIFPPDLGAAARLAVVANHLAFEIIAYGLLSLIAASAAQPILSRKAVFDRITAGILGALGLRLMLDRP